MARSLVTTSSGVINLEHVLRFSLDSSRNFGQGHDTFTLHLPSASDSKIFVSQYTEREAFEIIEDWVNARTIRPRPRVRLNELSEESEQ